MKGLVIDIAGSSATLLIGKPNRGSSLHDGPWSHGRWWPRPWSSPRIGT